MRLSHIDRIRAIAVLCMVEVHTSLLTSLAEVNQMIHRAANLRVGRAKSDMISKSRAALKQNNMQGLLRILSGNSNTSTAGAAEHQQ